MFRHLDDHLEVLLVHPGGPFWAGKNEGVWTVPKGEPHPGEDLLVAAQREFEEETGFRAQGPFLELGTIQQAGGKLVTAWAFAGNCDPQQLRSNLCEIEWPPRSRKKILIPEVDRGAWFGLSEAHRHIKETQRPFLDRLVEMASQPAPLGLSPPRLHSDR